MYLIFPHGALPARRQFLLLIGLSLIVNPAAKKALCTAVLKEFGDSR